MSERLRSQVKVLNFDDSPETEVICSQFSDQSSINLEEFTKLSMKIENEIKEKNPEEILMNARTVSAFTKATLEALGTALKEMIKESEDSLTQVMDFIQKSRSIFANMLVIVRKVNCKLKVPKNLLSHMKSVIMWVISKPHHERFIPDIFLFLTLIYEIILNSKKTGIKDAELAQVSDMLIGLLDSFLNEKRLFKTACTIFKFTDFHPAGIYYSESLSTDLMLYLLIGVENVLKVETSQLVEFVRNCLPSVLVHILDIPEFSEHQESIQTELAMEKYLSFLQIFRMLCGHNKTDIARTFLKNNSEKIKNIFFYTMENYVNYYFKCSSEEFDNDEGVIGRIYKTLLEIMSLSFIGSDQEGFPILFCSVVLQKVRTT